MAAPTTSAALTALNQAKPVLQAVNTWGGRMRRKTVRNHTIPFAAAAIGDRHALLRFNSGDVPVALFLYSNGLSTAAAAYNVGLYLANGGAAVDVDCFCSALVLGTLVTPEATAAQINYMYEAAVYTALNAHLPLWDVATALTEDPLVQYDLELTATVASTVADFIVGADVWYVSGD